MVAVAHEPNATVHVRMTKRSRDSPRAGKPSAWLGFGHDRWRTMTTHAVLAGLRRFQKEYDERAAAKYCYAAIASSVAALLYILALCFADHAQAPWQAYVSVGVVVSECVRQLWKAYFTAASRAWESRQKLHDVELRIAKDDSGENRWPVRLGHEAALHGNSAVKPEHPRPDR